LEAARAPDRPNSRKVEGRGLLAKYEIRYNKRSEKFEGKVVYTAGE
jgi:hypothetical protein